MTLDQLKTFYIVANAGSFTSAAIELNMDQSNVSRKIISMETRLRTKLFTRKARGLVLTPEGQALLEETKEILNRIEGMKNIIKNVHNEARGLLTISVLDSFYEYFLLPHLDNFLQKYPDIHLAINKVDGWSVSDLESSEMMIAVRPYMQNVTNVVQEFLTRLHIKLYASPEYLKDKEATTRRWLQIIKPKSILDLGANTGKFSFIAAEYAEKVISLEGDTTCVDKIEEKINLRKLDNLFTLIGNVADPSPTLGLLNIETESIYSRASADLVLGLALIHHLHITEKLYLKQLNIIFKNFKNKYLIIEFIPEGDPKVSILIKGDKSKLKNYNLEYFKELCSTLFEIIEMSKLNESNRTLLLLKVRK